MKKTDFLNKYLGPIVLILAGLLLIVSPDSASVLIANVISLVLVAAAIGFGISAIKNAKGRGWKVAGAIIFAIGGGWLHSHPLTLASFIGRFCGMFLWINGFQTIRANRALGKKSIFPWISAIIGLAMFLVMPLSVSRLVFTLCGIVALVMGILMLLDNFRGNKRLQEPDDPDIIDAL